MRATTNKREQKQKTRRISTRQVLEGLHEKAEATVLGRLYAAVLTSTVQRVPPTTEQLHRLNSAGAKSEVIGGGGVDTDDADKVRGQPFGKCYVTWRLENLRSAAIAMFVRAVFTGWAVVNSFQAAAAPPVTCKEAICETTGACGSCLPNEDCLPELDDVAIRALRASDPGCPSYMGVVPTAQFPLLADHVREALAGYEGMMLAQTAIRFACEIGAIACVCFAWRTWAHYKRSNRLVRGAFVLALIPPFVMALSFPLQLGLDSETFLRRLCADATSLVSEPGATPGTTTWALGLNLPPRHQFCQLPPKEWGPRIEAAMQEDGVIAGRNASSKSRGLTCATAERRRATCEVGICRNCFGEIKGQTSIPGQTVTNEVSLRNPCIDYATMSQVCLGRDQDFAAELQAACPEYTALETGPADISAVACDLSASPDYQYLRTGGFADEYSYCGITKEVMLQPDNSVALYQRCSECYRPMGEMNHTRLQFIEGLALARTDASNGTAEEAWVVPPDAGENTTCVEYCASAFTSDMLGSRIAPSFVPDLCAGADLLQHVGAIRNLADAFDAAKAAFGVSILLQTIITLAPASLSLVLGLIKGSKVLKSSLPWVRAPSYQIVVSTVVILPLIVSIMAGIFQIAADLYSLGFSVCIVASFLHNLPTEAFLSAKSYRDTLKEMQWRGYIQTFFLLLALAFLGLWIGLSERLAQVLKDTNILSIDDLVALDRPNTPTWTLVTIVLDFFGKSVVAKLCFCDLLLLMVAQTELAEPTAHQRVMRDEVQILYSMRNDQLVGAKAPTRTATEAPPAGGAAAGGASAAAPLSTCSSLDVDVATFVAAETSPPPPGGPPPELPASLPAGAAEDGEAAAAVEDEQEATHEEETAHAAV